ncbi:unnamed protein product [Pocillopora meandrina]|uniref:Uncharacterized protein n=1 Tax=Pocillopora meandrina TaxID=46732 RepID=A0AAU9VXT7_9CNID|nr:unnamed protein product [Pocillopora meandrina]
MEIYIRVSSGQRRPEYIFKLMSDSVSRQIFGEGLGNLLIYDVWFVLFAVRDSRFSCQQRLKESARKGYLTKLK